MILLQLRKLLEKHMMNIYKKLNYSVMILLNHGEPTILSYQKSTIPNSAAKLSTQLLQNGEIIIQVGW